MDLLLSFMKRRVYYFLLWLCFFLSLAFLMTLDLVGVFMYTLLKKSEEGMLSQGSCFLFC